MTPRPKSRPLPRATVLFNQNPFEVLVDGQPYPERAVQDFGRWSLRLPRGQHTVEIIAGSPAWAFLGATSRYASNLIVVFGTVAVGLMCLIYLFVLVRRAMRGKAAGSRVASS